MTSSDSYRHIPGTAGTPAILTAMIWANITVFACSLLFSGKQIHLSMNPFDALAPSLNVLRFLGAAGVSASRLPLLDIWWTFITANWLHGSLIHLAFNMIALRQIAPLVIGQYGPFRMFTIYTLSGVLGFLLSYKATVYLTVGASSGICGLIGAALFFGRTCRSDYGKAVFRQTSGWVVSLILIGFLIPNINNWSHGGGLAGGIAAGWIMGYAPKRNEHLIDRIISILFMGLTAFLLAKSVITGFMLIYT